MSFDPTVEAEPNQLGTTAITDGVVPVLVPADRYRTDEFAELERERLWPLTWQVACSTDHVLEPGDWYEYRCGALSVIVVRNPDGVLRAFQNTCRHRGNAIVQGAGSGLDELRCPYHRWSWDLDGALVEVPSRRGFGPGLAEGFGLFEVQVDTWGPLVFVNLDPVAEPLGDYLEAVPADAAWVRLEEFACQAMVTTTVVSNWKVVAEGFSETYHVQGIHSELLGAFDDLHAAQVLWGNHGVSYQAYGVPSPRLGAEVTDQQVWDAFIETQGGRMGITEPCPVPEIPAGSKVADVIAEQIRVAERERGVDLGDFTNDQVMHLSQYNLFPNVTVLISADLVSALLARPGPTPHTAVFSMLHFKRQPAGIDRVRAAEFHVTEDVDLGKVMSQDLGVLRTAQVGLRQPGLTHLAIGAEEARIINLHRNLERQLAIEPSELLPIQPS